MGVDHISHVFENNNKEAAFMPYVVAGYPDLEKSIEIIHSLVDSGADLLELGVPFSDPIADGPVIQTAAHKALANGITLQRCIDLVSRLRKEGVEIPILLMSYVNPFIAYGLERIVKNASAVGIDGFIVPDLPPEESGEFEEACKKYGEALIYLLAPTSSEERIRLVAERSSGFIYLVSLTGVTGARNKLAGGLQQFIDRVRKAADLPLAVGFGISNAEQTASVAQMADGVIVGSALVHLAGQSIKEMRKLANEIHDAISKI